MRSIILLTRKGRETTVQAEAGTRNRGLFLWMAILVVLAATRLWRRVRVATRKYTPGCVCVCVCCACAVRVLMLMLCSVLRISQCMKSAWRKRSVVAEKEKKKIKQLVIPVSPFLGQTKPKEAEINQTQGNHISTFRAEEKQCYYYYSDDCHASWKARRDPFLLSVTLSRGRIEKYY